MARVKVTVDGVILNCDETVASLELGNGYIIEKKYLSDIPFRNKLIDGEGNLAIDYMLSQLKDEQGVYFMCIHKEDSYEIQMPEIEPGQLLTDRDIMCANQLTEYKQQEIYYLNKVFSLLNLFKEGNIGYIHLFFEHTFMALGFIKNTFRQTDNNVTKNIIADTLFSLSDQEIEQCNDFLKDISNEEFRLIKNNVDEFTWGLDQLDVPTGFEQYTTALEMTLLEKYQRAKKETLSKRVSVLLETDPQKIKELYNKMRNFYRYRSESLHEGNGDNITATELKEMEEIVRRVLRKYLEFCKTARINNPTITWDEIKSNKINDIIGLVSNAVVLDILPNQG